MINNVSKFGKSYFDGVFRFSYFLCLQHLLKFIIFHIPILFNFFPQSCLLESFDYELVEVLQGLLECIQQFVQIYNIGRWNNWNHQNQLEHENYGKLLKVRTQFENYSRFFKRRIYSLLRACQNPESSFNSNIKSNLEKLIDLFGLDEFGKST